MNIIIKERLDAPHKRVLALNTMCPNCGRKGLWEWKEYDESVGETRTYISHPTIAGDSLVMEEEEIIDYEVYVDNIYSYLLCPDCGKEYKMEEFDGDKERREEELKQIRKAEKEGIKHIRFDNSINSLEV